ncbi:MAG: citrate synthase/methylcitrate synthase [Chloroflexi bacterium]|nr:citrate synthase/methylcitrate synthase [Chloroflexota bacterium]
MSALCAQAVRAPIYEEIIMTTTASYQPGLEGVVAAETRLSHVDGQSGELIIGGYALEEVAAKATAEQMAYLLWHDRLPDEAELAVFSQGLAEKRPLSPATLSLLKAVAQEKAPVMDALRIGAGTLSLGLDAATSSELAEAIVARFPTIVAAYWRFLNGQEAIAPDADLNHAANYLYMLTGERPSAAQVRGLETYLNTVSDHSLNASTFTARVIVSTGSDLASAITGAVGALKGPLHGGAPGPALDMVFEIGSAENAEPYLRAKLERGDRLMGFGHRVYKVRDPRADVLGRAAASLYAADGDMALYELARAVEETAVSCWQNTNQDAICKPMWSFYTALLLHGLGLSTALFTPTFAIGRVAGWLGHCFEQMENGRLIRPSSRYVGEIGRQW